MCALANLDPAACSAGVQPANLLLVKGRLKLADMGIVKRIRDGNTAATLGAPVRDRLV